MVLIIYIHVLLWSTIFQVVVAVVSHTQSKGTIMPDQRRGFWKCLVMTLVTIIGIIPLSFLLLPTVITVFASAIAAPVAGSWLSSLSP
jgi:hypothetical protein